MLSPRTLVLASALFTVSLAVGLDDALLTASPTAPTIPKTTVASTAASDSSGGVHLTESALAGIIVGSVLDGLLLGLVTSAGIFVCLGRRARYHEHFDEMEEDFTSSADSPEKPVPLSPRGASHPPVRPPRTYSSEAVLPLALVPSGTSEGPTPTLPTITAGGSIGTPADWEAERAVETTAPCTTVPLGYSDYRPVTPTRFWRGLRERRASGLTIKSAKTKAKRASIVTLKSNKSAKSRRASILTARSKLSGRSGKKQADNAPPVPPLPFTRRIPVPPLSPSLQPTRPPPKRPRRRIHQLHPDPPLEPAP